MSARGRGNRETPSKEVTQERLRKRKGNKKFTRRKGRYPEYLWQGGKSYKNRKGGQRKHLSGRPEKRAADLQVRLDPVIEGIGHRRLGKRGGKVLSGITSDPP